MEKGLEIISRKWEGPRVHFQNMEGVMRKPTAAGLRVKVDKQPGG
jgi:hypothetical protein